MRFRRVFILSFLRVYTFLHNQDRKATLDVQLLLRMTRYYTRCRVRSYHSCRDKRCGTPSRFSFSWVTHAELPNNLSSILGNGMPPARLMC